MQQQDITLNNTPFSDNQIQCYLNKQKLPRKLKKQINNYFLSRGKYQKKGILIYDESFKALNKSIDWFANLYKSINE